MALTNANPESFPAGIKRERFWESAESYRDVESKPLHCIIFCSIVITPKLLSQC